MLLAPRLLNVPDWGPLFRARVGGEGEGGPPGSWGDMYVYISYSTVQYSTVGETWYGMEQGERWPQLPCVWLGGGWCPYGRWQLYLVYRETGGCGMDEVKWL